MDNANLYSSFAFAVVFALNIDIETSGNPIVQVKVADWNKQLPRSQFAGADKVEDVDDNEELILVPNIQVQSK